MSAFRMIDTDTHITAVNSDDVEICGAFQPVGHQYWTMFVTKLVSDATGVQTPPHREHFWGLNGRVCARLWVETIAALYSGVRVTRVPLNGADVSGSVAQITGDE